MVDGIYTDMFCCTNMVTLPPLGILERGTRRCYGEAIHWFIYDGKTVISRCADCIAISSPNRDRWREMSRNELDAWLVMKA